MFWLFCVMSLMLLLLSLDFSAFSLLEKNNPELKLTSQLQSQWPSTDIFIPLSLIIFWNSCKFEILEEWASSSIYLLNAVLLTGGSCSIVSCKSPHSFSDLAHSGTFGSPSCNRPLCQDCSTLELLTCSAVWLKQAAQTCMFTVFAICLHKEHLPDSPMCLCSKICCHDQAHFEFYNSVLRIYIYIYIYALLLSWWYLGLRQDQMDFVYIGHDLFSAAVICGGM